MRSVEYTFLELSTTNENVTIFSVEVVLGSCNPTNAILVVEFSSSTSKIRRHELHAIVVDKDVRTTTLHFVCGDRRFDTAYGGNNYSSEAFFVDRHLNSAFLLSARRSMDENIEIHHLHMGKTGTSMQTLRPYTTVKFAILADLLDWANELTSIGNEDLEEELDHHVSNILRVSGSKIAHQRNKAL